MLITNASTTHQTSMDGQGMASSSRQAAAAGADDVLGQAVERVAKVAEIRWVMASPPVLVALTGVLYARRRQGASGHRRSAEFAVWLALPGG